MSDSRAFSRADGDQSSLSTPSCALRTEHISWELAICFTTRILRAKCMLHVRVLDRGTSELRLDTRGLRISAVTLLADEKDQNIQHAKSRPLLYTLQPGPTQTGDALCIALPSDAISASDPEQSTPSIKILIDYETDGCGGGSSAGGACAWLDPPQTAGNCHPYMFTQCQAVHARSILPCQDTPGVKATFDAKVTVEWPHHPMQVVMSALLVDSPSMEDGSTRTFRFVQPRPVPSYLIAIAAGDLESRDLSSRCRIWAEPNVINDAAYEFSETEKMLACAESIAGPYPWERYDLCVMPPAFPYGGMENVNCTFVTPTLLAGDRSLVSVVAHEIAHSWSGNLVSCANWSHFWINEGFTVYLERAIIKRLYGAPRAGLSAYNGRRGLAAYISNTGDSHNYTKLVPDLQLGADPDDAFSLVPYEKGFQLLQHLERKCVAEHKNEDCTYMSKVSAEDDDVFLSFLRDWFNDHAFKSVSSTDFVSYFQKKFPGTAASIDFEKWLYDPGPVIDEVRLDLSLVQTAAALASRWMDAANALDSFGAKSKLFAEADVEGWSSAQMIAFLTDLLALIRMQKDKDCLQMNASAAEHMGTIYNLDISRNAEIRYIWCQIGLLLSRTAAVKQTCDFVLEQGRMKYVRPLYLALHTIFPRGSLSQEVFDANKQMYHPIAAKMIATCFTM